MQPDERPGVTHRVVRSQQAVGWVLAVNPVELVEPLLPADSLALIVRPGRPADSDQPAWLPGPRQRGELGLGELERLAGTRELVLWPARDQIISDVPSLLTFLRSHERWRVLLDPGAMVGSGEGLNAEEFVQRLAEVMLDHPALWAMKEPEPESPAAGPYARLVTPRLGERARVVAAEKRLH